MENMFAFTDMTGAGYPGYVSINRTVDGDVSVTVRSKPEEVDGVFKEGRQATFVVPAVEWKL